MIAEKHETRVVEIHNIHAESCGLPPAICNSDPKMYYGYFENEHGEQWVVQIDPKAKRGTLRGGDIGWDTEVDITDGRASGVILNEPEHLWLIACWSAATGEIPPIPGCG